MVVGGHTRRQNKNSTRIPNYKHIHRLNYVANNVRPNVFYTWKEKFINGGKMALSVSKHENINQNLQSENEHLKKLIAGELTIVNYFLKKR